MMHFCTPYRLLSAGNLGLHLHPKHLADLRKSGLSDHTTRDAGVYSMRPRDIALFFNLRRGVPDEIESGLCFPYQGGGFARIKLFPALDKMKYSQPAGTGARLYIPFPVNDGPVIIAEGEKKSLAAYQAGLNAVAIGGLWNWLCHGEPIDDLNLIGWDGRELTIIPDSDVFNRRDLLRAVYALGYELRSLGASVLVAQIPQTGTAKVGLDDYLVTGGTVDRLEVFSLGHRIFKSCQFWHRRWKFQKALGAAA